MGDTKREVNESPLTQGTDESIAYTIDFTRWGTPSSPTVTLYDETAAEDVSSTNLTGSASVDSNEVTTPAVHSLTRGHNYRLSCVVTIDGNTMSAFLRIKAERK